MSGVLSSLRNDGGCAGGVASSTRIPICRHTFASSRLFRPSFASTLHPHLKEGAGKTGCRLAPAVHCARVQSEDLHSGIQVKPKHPAFPAQWFDGLCRDLPGERCTIAPVALQMTDGRARLGHTHHHKTWRTGSGRQDHTILPYADHTGRLRDILAHGCPPCDCLRADVTNVHRRPARVVTIAIRPSSMGRVARHIRRFRISVKWNIFADRCCPTPRVFCPPGNARTCGCAGTA